MSRGSPRALSNNVSSVRLACGEENGGSCVLSNVPNETCVVFVARSPSVCALQLHRRSSSHRPKIHPLAFLSTTPPFQVRFWYQETHNLQPTIQPVTRVLGGGSCALFSHLTSCVTGLDFRVKPASEIFLSGALHVKRPTCDLAERKIVAATVYIFTGELGKDHTKIRTRTRIRSFEIP